MDGQLIFNASHHIVDAALQSNGIAYLPEAEFEPHIKQGRLVKVLKTEPVLPAITVLPQSPPTLPRFYTRRRRTAFTLRFTLPQTVNHNSKERSLI